VKRAQRREITLKSYNLKKTIYLAYFIQWLLSLQFEIVSLNQLITLMGDFIEKRKSYAYTNIITMIICFSFMNGIIARVQLKSFHLFLQQFPFERCTARCRRALRKYM